MNNIETDEILFENIFMPTEGTYRDFISCQTSHGGKVKNYIWGGVALLASIALFINVEQDLLGVFALSFGILGLLFAGILFVAPKVIEAKKLQQLLKRSRLLSSEDDEFIKYETYFQNDSFEAGGEIRFQYDQISKIMVSTLYMFIMIEDTVHTAVKKDAFTIGDYESFVVFLKEKLKDNPVALLGLLEGTR